MPVTVTPVTNAVQQSATQTAAILTSSSTVATKLASSVSKTIKRFTINSEIHRVYIIRCFIFALRVSFYLFDISYLDSCGFVNVILTKL